MVRKAGKLPGTTIKQTYGIEYGNADNGVTVRCIKKGTKILIADDLLATGGTAISRSQFN